MAGDGKSLTSKQGWDERLSGRTNDDGVAGELRHGRDGLDDGHNRCGSQPGLNRVPNAVHGLSN